MGKRVEERFERIEKNPEKFSEGLNEIREINKETALLARENQKRLDQLLADTDKTREKMDEFIEAQREKV